MKTKSPLQQLQEQYSKRESILTEKVSALLEDKNKLLQYYKKHTAYIKSIELKLRESKRKIQQLELNEAKLQAELKKRTQESQKWQFPLE